ncbi:TPR-like protein, partial [Athelia psychrophila]
WVSGDIFIDKLRPKLKPFSVLDKLVYAQGASWDPKLVCLPGTRAKILSVIHAWLRSFDTQNLFWLNAVAGAGKTAIAHTIAQALHDDGLLASSFFFDRNDASRNTPRLLVTTIACDLAMRHPAIATDISAALEEEPSLASAPLSRQFEAFIAGPLRRHPVDHPIVIVIDALDEAISDDSDTSLLGMLRDEASHLPPQLRILITSRSTWIVDQYLSEHTHILSHPINIHSLDSRQDIAAYVNAELRDPLFCSRMGPNWPDEALIAELELLAEGLFIWIATICSYLRSTYNPRAKLDALLARTLPQGLDPAEKIYILYASILEICVNWEDPDFVQDYHLVVGAIMAAKRPLSLIALKALHGSSHPIALSADILLERFGSVLVGFKTDHEPIRMLHLSFREFVTKHADNDQHTRKFYVSEKLHSGRLAELCIQTMVRELSAAEIQGTGYLNRHDDDPPDIPEVTGVSEQLLYSCDSWNDHVSDVTQPSHIMVKHLRVFLLHHTIMWMEVIASESIFLGLLSVFSWVKDHAPEIRELYDDQSQASALSSLAKCLSYEGRLEEALTADQEAVQLYRTLSTEQPALFNADLALSLASLSISLSDVGRMEEALTVAQEAVDIRRAFTAARPAVFNAHLADSLANLSVDLAAAGRTEEALAAVQEAVDLRRALAAERPAVFNGDLATSLSNLSIYLSAIGRTEEALTAVQEAVDLRRAVAAEPLAIFDGDLAHSLTSLSAYLSAIGRTEEALTAVQEAVDLRRALATARPAMFNADLALSLYNMCIYFRLSYTGRLEEALTADQEAVNLHRALAAERPAMFNADLARSLTNLSADHAAVGRLEEALTVVQEAVELRRALTAERPAVYNAELADSLTNLSVDLAAVGRTEEALTAVQEAVDLRRALAAKRPTVFNADLANSLCNLSVHLSAVGRREEALTAVHEAVDLRRALAAKRPAVFNADLANSLSNLSVHLSAVGRREEALVVVQEVVDLRRALAAERPAVFNDVLANSLTNLSNCLSDVGRTEEALVVVQGAVDLRRAIAAERPAVSNADLSGSLNNLSNRLSDVGRTEEALTAIEEAVDMRRALAAERPAVFNAPLARSLYNLSFNLSDISQKEEALTAVQEAVDLYRTLAEERPALYNYDLTDSLERVSAITSSMCSSESTPPHGGDARGPDE